MPAADQSRLELTLPIDERNLALSVYSGSMRRSVAVAVLRAADTSVPRPTLYLLDGVTRVERTDALAFFADKNVNVVIPTGGENAWWTDWESPDPVLGVNKWQTFLTRELPPIIDAALGTTGVNAAAGMSRTGTAALQLAIAAPGVYRAVASYSGCANSSGPLGQAFVRLSMNEYGGGNAINMWGPPGDPAWAANDPYVNAAGLRGVALYISNGSGIPGRYDNLNARGVDGQFDKLIGQVVTGGGIEAVTNYCTHQLADRLNALGIPATYNFRSTGTHSWNYWRDDLHDSWPVLAGALGIE
nr:alpha/beta hydrolase family protein [Antrihabitans sp. YC2-6]